MFHCQKGEGHPVLDSLRLYLFVQQERIVKRAQLIIDLKIQLVGGFSFASSVALGRGGDEQSVRAERFMFAMFDLVAEYAKKGMIHQISGNLAHSPGRPGRHLVAKLSESVLFKSFGRLTGI